MPGQQRFRSGLSLLFAEGDRPSADDIDAALRSGGADVPAAMISLRPPPTGTDGSDGSRGSTVPDGAPSSDAGWIELLASGLTFEMRGLAPAAPLPVTPAAHTFGFAADASGFAVAPPPGTAAVALIPGPHIAAGAAMMPVVRTITGLAAGLTLALPVRAVCWEPIACWMEPRYFARAILAWLAGGPFPALGLTAIEEEPGYVVSRGLAFFSGQEVRVARQPGEPPSSAAKLAIRVIDNILRNGAITQRTELYGSPGVTVIVEPSADGRVVTVWRGQ